MPACYLIAGVLGKVSVDDKMRIQTLREQGLGYRAIAAKYMYPEKIWKLDTVKLICKCVDETVSALTPENQAEVDPDEWPPNSSDLNPLDYHVWAGYAWTLQDISTQAK